MRRQMGNTGDARAAPGSSPPPASKPNPPTRTQQFNQCVPFITMSRRQPKTAAEVMRELHATPSYVKGRSDLADELELREAAFRTLSRSLLERLANRGYPLESLDRAEIIGRYAPLPEELTQILLASVESLGKPLLQEQAVRALGATDVSYDGTALAGLFKSTRRAVRSKGTDDAFFCGAVFPNPPEVGVNAVAHETEARV
jgi:hypothetical protein